VYGARPLKRVIQNKIENPLAQQVLQGDYIPGDSIAIDIDSSGELTFAKAAAIIDSQVA